MHAVSAVLLVSLSLRSARWPLVRHSPTILVNITRDLQVRLFPFDSRLPPCSLVAKRPGSSTTPECRSLHSALAAIVVRSLPFSLPTFQILARFWDFSIGGRCALVLQYQPGAPSILSIILGGRASPPQKALFLVTLRI